MGAVMLDTVQAYYDVKDYTRDAKGITWDTCHKIYIMMDDEQVALMRSYGYGEDDPNAFATSDQLDPAEMATVLMAWYKQSCGLKFINAVYSDERGFVDVIAQFEGNEGNWDEDEDEDV
jgi:hypothetical protein